MSLENRRILVTGASAGIGRATAILCSKLGAGVVLVGRNQFELNKTLSLLDEGKHLVLAYDLSNMENIELLMNECIAKGEKLNGLVHSAGITAIVPIGTLNCKKMQDIMQINYFAFMELVKFYSKKKYSNSGSIVAISSVASLAGLKGTSVYCGSKGALDSSIRSLSLELAQKNIRINSVLPSYIKTEMYDSVTDLAGEETKDQNVSKQILGLGSVDDVANAAAFLLSDASRFITGSSLVVDGGYLAQ
jgi:NAD(P)-dependent dehydrogenase (short-subunit alcohol dehydrogenase family)